MGEIKSAREIAMERINAMGEPTEEERCDWKYRPEGEKLAARFLKGEAKLSEELANFDKKALDYVKRGISSILMKNINLPANESAQKTNLLAMEGLKAIKTDKTKTEALLKQLQQIFQHYSGVGEQQRNQAYEQLKEDFQLKVEQALRQQMGGQANNLHIDIEKQPQFLEEWRKIKGQLDSQYIQVLTELKQQLEAVK
jgi:hypothetical protein